MTVRHPRAPASRVSATLHLGDQRTDDARAFVRAHQVRRTPAAGRRAPDGACRGTALPTGRHQTPRDCRTLGRSVAPVRRVARCVSRDRCRKRSWRSTARRPWGRNGRARFGDHHGRIVTTYDAVGWRDLPSGGRGKARMDAWASQKTYAPVLSKDFAPNGRRLHGHGNSVGSKNQHCRAAATEPP